MKQKPLAVAALSTCVGPHQKSTFAFNALLCVAAAVVIAVRDPSFLIQPRFWAEEGAVYFQSALDRPPLEALFAPHQGYFSLIANVGGILATLPSLEYAPLVTTMIAFIIQLSLVIAIALSNAPFLKSALSKTLASAALILVGARGDLWFTTISSQQFFPVLVFLILCHDKYGGRGLWLRAVVISLSGLASVTACFLLPLFLIRYIQRRQTEDRLLFSVLAASTAIQLAVIAYSYLVLGQTTYYDPSSQVRFASPVPLSYLPVRIAYYAIQYPVLGRYQGLVASFGINVAAVLLMIYAATRRCADYWHFLGAIWVLTVFSVLGSIQMNGGPRYAYAPSCIFALFLLAIAFDEAVAPLFRRLSVVLFAIAMVVWVPYYRSGLDGFRNPAWPSWAEEVRAWRSDPSHSALYIHPDWPSQRKQGLAWVVRIKRP